MNGQVVEGTVLGTSHRESYDTGWLRVSDRPTVVYDNHVDADALRTLSFQKKLLDKDNVEQSEENDATTFNFRLYLSNGVEDTLSLANMYTYYVKNPNGYLCRWDAEAQKFVATDKTSYKSLTDEEKEYLAFDTSMNGSISKIPAGYTVEVPNLPVGTRFKVEERLSEIPLGYQFIKYERDSGTYHTEDGDTLNSGWVRAHESPKMTVYNRRGWGLRVDKVWSDKKFTSSYDPVYIAVYLHDEVVPDTVRSITYPETSVRYFFENLIPGTVYSDYNVYEVELDNPVLDENGELVSYDGIEKRLNDGDLTLINAVSSKTGKTEAYPYAVTYDKGIPYATARDLEEGNVREDTITNTRSGGVVITLYDMLTKEPLAGGTFTLTEGDKNIGTFTSDENGRVTILYDFDRDQNYVLTETGPPGGYIGLPNAAVFSIGHDNSVTITGNEAQWEKGYKSDSTDNGLIAYIDVFNKPFTLQAIKVDSKTNHPLADAHFALYRSVSGIGGTVKDFYPMSGYEDLVTGDDGVIPKINNTLAPGKYYLKEVTPPTNYEGVAEDIVFTISSLGEVIINSDAHSDYLSVTGESDSAYVISVPNEKINDMIVPTGIFASAAAFLMLLILILCLTVLIKLQNRKIKD